MNELIKWPTGQKLIDTIDAFERMKGFPGVVGAIDGTHIPIKAPKENPNDYINRKFFHSIQLQAVFDADLLCTDAFCGFPGRIHDARAFRNSPLFEDARSGPDELFPGNTHILGDSAYPLQKWLLTPFKNYGNLIETTRDTIFDKARQGW